MTTTEKCPTCDGLGCEYGCGNCRKAYSGPDSHRICRKCGGSGWVESK